jgi:hypothetical protein
LCLKNCGSVRIKFSGFYIKNSENNYNRVREFLAVLNLDIWGKWSGNRLIANGLFKGINFK